ncbi:MAG: membrane protein insertase YidC [Flavobacteriaceae bacterium]|nr:membrane protein insertase YidC [Flavobacteriaceae bacterium]
MEEKQFDPYQFIGFILIAMILTWMLFRNQNVPSQDETISQTNNSVSLKISKEESDSFDQDQNKITYGIFSELMNPAENIEHELQNEDLKIKISSKGANLTLVNLKNFTNYLGLPLNLIADDNNLINTTIKSRVGLTLETKNIFFKEIKYDDSDIEKSISLRAKITDFKYIQFKYILPKKGFKLKLEIRTEGLEDILSSDNIVFNWKKELFRNSKSIDYENRYTQLTYAYEDDKTDNLSLSSEDEELEDEIRWISYRQHFFSSILIPDKILNQVSFSSADLTVEKKLNNKYTKRLITTFEIPKTNGNIISNMDFYFGPTDYQLLRSYGNQLETSVPLGWGIFGWINRFIFLPLFGFLASYFPYGISIIILTIIVRLAMSPVVYKSYVSQIKMKTLKPEIEEITAKHKNNAVKKQQETMALYSKAGVNPMSGCIPALIQLPIFYALFTFFPVAFELRQKSFLWADDLSSYDSIFELPFSIPFYGDHVSLFPILASAAIFVYTLMTTGQQTMPQQEGMPNMKFIIYMMPLMMLFFFNNYASGLSLYYFVSNTLTIILMLVIKNFIIKEDRIRTQIAENKKKPRKKGGFSERLQKAMEAAEAQKRMNQKR